MSFLLKSARAGRRYASAGRRRACAGWPGAAPGPDRRRRWHRRWRGARARTASTKSVRVASLRRVTRIASSLYCSRKPRIRPKCGLPAAWASRRWKARSSSTPSRPSAALRSIARSARRRAATWSRVARSAASAAVSASSARRTSRTCITSSSEAIRLRSSCSAAAGGAVDVDAGALARAQQAARLELVHRLAHDGARDAVGGGEAGLGRKPVAGAQAPGLDLVAEAVGEAVGQALGDEGRHVGRTDQGGAGQHGGRVIIRIGPGPALPVCPHGAGRPRCRYCAQPGRGSRLHASAHGQRHDQVRHARTSARRPSCTASTSTSPTAPSPCWSARRAAASRPCCA